MCDDVLNGLLGQTTRTEAVPFFRRANQGPSNAKQPLFHDQYRSVTDGNTS